MTRVTARDARVTSNRTGTNPCPAMNAVLSTITRRTTSTWPNAEAYSEVMRGDTRSTSGSRLGSRKISWRKASTARRVESTAPYEKPSSSYARIRSSRVSCCCNAARALPMLAEKSSAS